MALGGVALPHGGALLLGWVSGVFVGKSSLGMTGLAAKKFSFLVVMIGGRRNSLIVSVPAARSTQVSFTMKSSGAKFSIFCAAMASLTFNTVTAVAKADSPGQLSGMPLRMASKKFSRCGW